MESTSPAIALLRNLLNAIKDFTLTALFSVLILPLFLILILVSIPIFVWRIVVKYAAPLCRKDLSKMLQTTGQLLAIDKIHETPQCNLIITFVGEGNVKAEDFKSLLNQKLIESPPKDSTGNEKYPELRQYLVKWGGYYFWKESKDFSLDNHFTVFDGKNYDEGGLKLLKQKYLGLKWPKGKPMWEFILIKNFVPKGKTNPGPHSALIFRTHHSLGDGYSLLYFIKETVAGKHVNNVAPNYLSRSLPRQLLYGITFPFRALWESAELAVQNLHSNEFRYNHPNKTLIKGPDGANLRLESSAGIPISLVKDVKSHFNTTFAAVQFAALAGALRDFQLAKGMDIPRVFPCLTVLPYPGHKLHKFRNHMSGATVNLPTCEADPLKRLQLSHKYHNKVKRSTLPMLGFYTLRVLGLYVRPITRFIAKNHPNPVGLSIFSAGDEPLSFLGIKWQHCFGCSGTLVGNTGLGILSLSYGDVIRISATGHPGILSKEDLQRIINLVEYHFEVLHQRIKLDV